MSAAPFVRHFTGDAVGVVERGFVADVLDERSSWGPVPNDQGLAFTREDGRALRPEYVTKHFQLLAKRAGLPAIRLHDLRHTNASLALSAGVDIKVVSDRLGHSTTAITADLYTHVDRGFGRLAANQIADILGADASAMPAHEVKAAPEHDGQLLGGQTKEQAPNRVSAGQGPAP